VLKSFDFHKVENTSGTSHEQWEGYRGGMKRKVTVDCHRGEVRALDVRSIVSQAGLSSKEFWRAVEKC